MTNCSIILIFIAHVHNFILTSMFSYMLTCQLLFNLSFYIILGCKLLIYPGDFNMTDGPTHWELLIRNRLVTLTSFFSSLTTCTPVLCTCIHVLCTCIHVLCTCIHVLCTCIHVNMFMTNIFTLIFDGQIKSVNIVSPISIILYNGS